MNRFRQYAAPAGAAPVPADAAQLLRVINAQAAFHQLVARHLAALCEAPALCTAVSVTCFGKMGPCSLSGTGTIDCGMYRTTPCRRAPISRITPPGCLRMSPVCYPRNSCRFLACSIWGRRPAPPDGGWTACLFGNVDSGHDVTAIDRGARPGIRAAGLDPGRYATGSVARVRNSMLQAVTELFATARDFWLLQTWDAVIMYDLDDVLG